MRYSEAVSCSKLPMQYRAACPDCPGARLGVLEPLVGETKDQCSFVSEHVAARSPLPPDWGTKYGFGLVRRGVVIRQRINGDGKAVAIDAAGSGCLFPIPEDQSGILGYCASGTVVCLCSRETIESAIADGDTSGDLFALHQAVLTRVERLAFARGAQTLNQKVARLLVVLAETLSPPRIRTNLPPGLQQRDMSALVGVRHESFCRALAKLDQNGWIARESGGAVTVLDIEALRHA